MYRVPKRDFEATVTLVGGKPRAVTLFLGGDPGSPTGFQTPRDLLNGVETFLPAVDVRGRLHLLQRDAVLVVSIDAAGMEAEAVPEDAPSPVRATIDVHLAAGRAVLRGEVEYVMPESRRRLQDYLNGGERFLALRARDALHLINKLHIAQIVPR